jgi:hypothetical protein
MANPSLRATSRQIEGVTIIPEMDMIPFHGGMDIVHEIYQLPLASFSDIQNFRPLRPGLIKRKGCIQLHTTPDSTNKIMTIFMFSKGKQSELYTYAQTFSNQILEATANPPTVTTGVFGSSVQGAATNANPDTTGALLPASWATINDCLFMTNGVTACTYSGDNELISNLIVYKSAAAIPDMPILGEDYNTHEVPANLDNLGTLAQYDCIFIRTDYPAEAFNISVGHSNENTADIDIDYWANDSTWKGASQKTDGTKDTGRTLYKTGEISFDRNTDAMPRMMFGATGYWYRVAVSAALSGEVEISNVTYDADEMFAELENVWNGIPVSAIEAYVYDDSAKTYSFYSGSGIDISALAAADKFYFNSYDQAIGFYASVGATPNTTAATTMTVKYWNGTAWTDTSASDGTSQDSKALAQDGWVTWVRPTDEKQSIFQSSNYYSHWYEVSLGTVMPADMVISIETIPYCNIDDFGSIYSLCSFKNRLVLGCEKLPGNIAISGAASPQHFNGADFAIQDVGDGRSNRVICIKKFYNELLVWQEEKGTPGGCLTLVEGYSPETFGKRIISTIHGTFSSKSAVVVEDVPIKVVENEAPQKVTAAFFLCRDGIFRTDGLHVERISTFVQDYFDPKSALCITRGYEKDHWIDYDSTYQVLRVGLVTGVSGTVPNIFLVYDIYTGAWSHDVLAQPLSCHCEVEATSGQFPLLQIGGGCADGTIYLLNSGLTDNGTAITASATMEFDGNGHDLHIEEIVVRSSGALTVTPTWDGTTNSDITIA